MSEKTYRVIPGEARGGTIGQQVFGHYGLTAYLHDVGCPSTQFVFTLPIEEVPLYV